MTDDQWHDALAALYRDEADRLVGFASFLVSGSGLAEELVHDTFAHLLQQPVALDAPGKLGAYVRTALVNRSRSRLRRLALERRTLRRLSVPPVEWSDPSAADYDDLRTAIRLLPRRQREVIVLRFHADVDVRTIAQSLGVSEGTVKTHLHRAMRSLRANLEGVGGDSEHRTIEREPASRVVGP